MEVDKIIFQVNECLQLFKEIEMAIYVASFIAGDEGGKRKDFL